MNIVRNSENANIYVFVTAIITFLCSFFMPMVFVFFLQESLYFSKTHWFFEAPTSAYVTFSIGMIWISIILFIYLFVNWKFEPRFLKSFTALLLCLSIPCFMLGVANYRYMDDEGLHINYLKTLNEITTFGWNDLKEVKEVYEKKNGTIYLKEYTFITKDNKVETLPISGKLGENRNRVLAKLKENGVPLESNYQEINE